MTESPVHPGAVLTRSTAGEETQGDIRRTIAVETCNICESGILESRDESYYKILYIYTLILVFFLESQHRTHYSFIRPHGDGTGWCRFEQTDGQAAIHTPPSFVFPDMGQGANYTGICRYVPMDVALSGGALDLQSLACRIERVDSGLGKDTCYDTCYGI